MPPCGRCWWCWHVRPLRCRFCWALNTNGHKPHTRPPALPPRSQSYTAFFASIASSARATSSARLMPVAFARASARFSRPCSTLRLMTFTPLPTLGLPRRTRSKTSRCSLVNGRPGSLSPWVDSSINSLPNSRNCAQFFRRHQAEYALFVHSGNFQSYSSSPISSIKPRFSMIIQRPRMNDIQTIIGRINHKNHLQIISATESLAPDTVHFPPPS